MRYLILALMVGVLSWANASSGVEVLSNPDRPLVLVKPGRVILRLASNRTTGFRWFYRASGSSTWILPVSVKFNPAKEGLVGSAGQAVWQFDVDRAAFAVPQLGSIELVYRRPWDKRGQRLVHFDVVVEPD